MPKVAEKDGAAVSDDDMVYGYDVNDGKEVVILSKEEKKAARPESDRKIKVTGFVSLSEVDQMYLDTPYILVPDGMPEAYSLLLKAFEVRGEAGIGRITIREKEYTALIHAYRGGLVLSTLKYLDEVRVPSEMDDLKNSRRWMGTTLTWRSVSLMPSARPDLSTNHDEARVKLAAIIEAKRRGEEIIAVKPDTVKPAVDLMAALKATLAAVEGQKATPSPQGEVT